MEVLVLRDAAALSLIGDPVVRGQWQDLFQRCPWATVFQDVPYLERWYELYATQYEPVLVLGRDESGDLAGLLCLGVERRSGRLVVAGAPHSEYTVWLARIETNDPYIGVALDRLAEQFPRQRLAFPCLPPGTPLDWLGGGRRRNWFCDLRAMARPLMAVGDGTRIKESLRKKSNRQHLRQLEKRGRLEFERIYRLEDIAEDIDEIFDLYDFRQCALFGSMPFRADPTKAPFLRALYDVPDLLHTTVWRLDGRIISGRIGFLNRGRAQVSLGYLSHSPSLGKHSPGRLHLYQLGLLLAQEGVPELDLTAGGDGYKERFATHHDTVHRLAVVFSGSQRLRFAAQAAVRRTTKRALGLISVTPADVRRQLKRVRSLRHQLLGSLGGLFCSMKPECRSIAYQLERARSVADRPDGPILQRDRLVDLLNYEPARDQSPSKAEFVRDAWARIERGDHVYTYVEDGSLIFHVWVTRTCESLALCQDGVGLRLVPHSILVEGLTGRNRQDDPGLLSASLAKILTDLAASGDESPVVVPVDSTDLAARRVLMELGFQEQPSSSAEDERTGFKNGKSPFAALRDLGLHDASMRAVERDG